MKLHILSDLHVEFWDDKDVIQIPDTGADVVVLAGDIHIKTRGVDWIKSHFPADKKIIYVLGNHEYYGGAYPQTLDKIKRLTDETHNIFLLENDFLDIGDVVFLGSTLWTDLNLFGDFILASRVVMEKLTDFRRIRYGKDYRKFYPSHFTHLFFEAKKFLENKLQEFKDKKIVVVTHHAPSKKSIDHIFQNDIVSSAFASNLDEFICNHPNIKLWIHGHTHNFRDYKICNTRVVSNQYGYYGFEVVEDFKPDFTVEV